MTEGRGKTDRQRTKNEQTTDRQTENIQKTYRQIEELHRTDIETEDRQKDRGQIYRYKTDR